MEHRKQNGGRQHKQPNRDHQPQLISYKQAILSDYYQEGSEETPTKVGQDKNAYTDGSQHVIDQLDARTSVGSKGPTQNQTGRPPVPSVNTDAPGNEVTRGPSQVHSDTFTAWPTPTAEMTAATAGIYEKVKATALHNHESARVTLPSSLNLAVWERESTSHEDDSMVLQGTRYGFPIQYHGPPPLTQKVCANHASARDHDDSITQYIEKELAHGALEGPFDAPPFSPWFHISPLMTREKADTTERRVIVDLSFPEGGVNKGITPHTFNGLEAVHNLPTVDAAVRTMAGMCPGDIHLAVVGLSRAYRHFPVCPMDWPLLGITHKGRVYFDRCTPFGARMSSYTMQKVAEFITRAMAARNIKAHMYLDDIILMAPSKEQAQRAYDQTLTLLCELGLKAAEAKLQPPSPSVKWLGIIIDIPNNQLRIPAEKTSQIKRCMAAASGRKYITKRHLQRVIGLANHLAKIVRAARVFICRILAALRAAQTDRITVCPMIRADLKWFTASLQDFDGKAIIPVDCTVRRIWADACPTGAGASDGKRCYAYRFPPDFAQKHHINALEALNCMAAVRTFVGHQHAGGTVQVHCDNRAAVDALTSGRARDPTLAACARGMWYHAARKDVDIKFIHVPGEEMGPPDALSRVYVDERHDRLARALIRNLSLTIVDIQQGAFVQDLI